MCYRYTAHVRPSVYSRVKCIHAVTSVSTVVTFTANCEELWKCHLCFPTWNVVTCILCMDFAMAMHVLLLTNTKGVFPTKGFCLGVYFLVFTRQCVRLVVFRVLPCSLKGRWYHWLTHERKFLRWFREVHDCPLVELPLALTCHIRRCGELYMRRIYVLIMITGYNIWNRGTLLNVWICATG